jgi:hypothetical protein
MLLLLSNCPYNLTMANCVLDNAHARHIRRVNASHFANPLSGPESSDQISTLMKPFD